MSEEDDTATALTQELEYLKTAKLGGNLAVSAVPHTEEFGRRIRQAQVVWSFRGRPARRFGKAVALPPTLQHIEAGDALPEVVRQLSRRHPRRGVTGREGRIV